MILVTLTAACTTSKPAWHDHDENQEFYGYHTFTWLAGDQQIQAPATMRTVDPSVRQHVREAIEAELARKGLQEAEATVADFVVSFTIGAHERIDRPAYAKPSRGPWRWGEWLFGNELPRKEYRAGTLAIDVFDGATHRFVWHGRSPERLDMRQGARTTAQVSAIVAKVLRDFPPQTSVPGC